MEPTAHHQATGVGLLVQHGMGDHVAARLEYHFSARRVQVQAYKGPRHHYVVLRRRGVARQGIAARVPSATPTGYPSVGSTKPATVG